MVQIMEFLLNLLLLKGKFLKTTASEVLQIAFKKCLQYRRKISPMDYDHMISSFDNMLDFINYNARHYTCEGSSYVVTSGVRCRLYEELGKIKEHEEEQSAKEMPENHQTNQMTIQSTSNKKNKEIQTDSNLDSTNYSRNERLQDKKKIKHQEFIIDNLHAILKSQEFLFKNIIKLVNFLEKDSAYSVKSNKKLEKIKKKLAACSDVLSNNTNSRNLADIINNIIEDEITRCRFRHGESKTSAEINLNVPVPRGIEAALENSRKTHETKKSKHKHEVKRPKENEGRKKSRENEKQKPVEPKKNQTLSKAETKEQPDKSLRRVKSEPAINSANKIKGIQIDIENTKNLIAKNEEHFLRFDNALWHSLTTLKYMSLKEDYCNMCKCAFHNKRHFVTFESRLCKQIKKNEEIENFGKFLAISNAVFQMLENRLVIAEVKPTNQLPAIAGRSETSSFNQAVTENPLQKLKQPVENFATKNLIKMEQEASQHVNKEVASMRLKPKISEDLKTFATLKEKQKVSPAEIKEERQNTAAKTSTVSTKGQVQLEEKGNITNNLKFSENDEQSSSCNNKQTNTIINGDNLEKCLKLPGNTDIKQEVLPVVQKVEKKTQKDHETSTKSLVNISQTISKNREELERRINMEKPEEKLSAKKKQSEDVVKNAKSNEDPVKISSEKSQQKNLPDLETKKESNQVNSDEKIPSNQDEKKDESKYKDKVEKNKEVSNAHILSKINIASAVKKEETIKNILLETIEKEIAQVVETGLNSSQNQESKEDKSTAGPAFIKKEDILLPLPIPPVNKYENKLTELKLTPREIIRNQQETNVILNSPDVRKYTTNVSFPIVKKCEDVPSASAKKIKGMSTKVRPEADKSRNEQEVKVVSLLKEAISCPFVNKEADKNKWSDKIISSTTNVQKKPAKAIKKIDSGRHIYEKSKNSQQLRKIPEPSLHFGFKKEPPVSTPIKKVDPPKVTHDALKKKYSLPSSQIKSLNVKKDQEIKKVASPSAKLEKEDDRQVNKEVKTRNKDSLLPNFSKKISAEIVKKKLNPQQQSQQGKKKLETMSLQTLANVDGKLFSIQGKPPQAGEENRTRSLSLIELKSEADLLNMSKKVFDELESTLHTVRIVNKHPVLSSKTATKGRKRKMDEPISKKFSTRPVVAEKCKKLDVMSNGDNLQSSKAKKEIKSTTSFSTEVRRKIPKGKSKTFLKQSVAEDAKIEITRPKCSTNQNEDDIEKCSLRRTTKAAIKKQQVLTIFPKVSKSEVRAKPKISSIQTDTMRRIRAKQVAKHVHFGKTVPETISCETVNRKTYTNVSRNKSDRVQYKTGDAKFKCK